MFVELLNAWAVSFDLPVLDWIQANMATPFLDKIMPIITVLGDAGIFWMICAAVLAITKKYRKIGFGMAIAMALGLLVCNIILKPGVARIRPYDFQMQYFMKEIPLIAGGMRATEAAFRCGFATYSSFTRAYGKYFGTTPTGRADIHLIRAEVAE